MLSRTNLLLQNRGKPRMGGITIGILEVAYKELERYVLPYRAPIILLRSGRFYITYFMKRLGSTTIDQTRHGIA